MLAFSSCAKKARSVDAVHEMAFTSDAVPLLTLTVALLGPVVPDVNDAGKCTRGRSEKVWFILHLRLAYPESFCSTESLCAFLAGSLLNPDPLRHSYCSQQHLELGRKTLFHSLFPQGCVLGDIMAGILVVTRV